jgi:hypothetical protein
LACVDTDTIDTASNYHDTAATLAILLDDRGTCLRISEERSMEQTGTVTVPPHPMLTGDDDADDIQLRIGRFKTDLQSMSVQEVVRRHITFGNCYALNDDQHYNLKHRISEHFSIHTTQVVVVGSGKLGFSIVNSKRYRPFHDASDIDVAIVSSAQFDELWKQVYDFRYLSAGVWPKEELFKKYLFRGWIRPDALPPTASFPTALEWWDLFRELTHSGDCGQYKLAAGLYKSWHFLEQYHMSSVRACKELME